MNCGILVANLGSPDSPEPPAVRRYLREFLCDPHVVDLPALIRWMLVGLIIAPIRAPKSAAAYQNIWTNEGSPLVVLSERLANDLATATGLPAALGMRYGKPSLHDAAERLSDCEELIVVPLYPQYARATRQTLYDELLGMNIRQDVRILKPFYNDPDYVEVVAAKIADSVREPVEHLLFSFHGLPERAIRKADPTGEHCLVSPECCGRPSSAHEFCYRHQCVSMAHRVADRLDMEWSMSFQSRLGRLPWLTPYTDVRIRELAIQGKKRIAIVAPAFMVDNLETLEELGMTGSEDFRRHGGEDLQLVPCLNDSPELVSLLARWIGKPSDRFQELHSVAI